MTGENNILEKKRARKQEREEEKRNSSIMETLSLVGKNKPTKKHQRNLEEGKIHGTSIGL